MEIKIELTFHLMATERQKGNATEKFTTLRAA